MIPDGTRSRGHPYGGIQYEVDIVTARQRARQLSALLGFHAQDQVRIATAVSEIGRNAFRYAGEASPNSPLRCTLRRSLWRFASATTGPGIGNLEAVLNGEYRSRTGLGSGLAGTRRLMEHSASSPRPGAALWSASARLSHPEAGDRCRRNPGRSLRACRSTSHPARLTRCSGRIANCWRPCSR